MIIPEIKGKLKLISYIVISKQVGENWQYLFIEIEAVVIFIGNELIQKLIYIL